MRTTFRRRTGVRGTRVIPAVAAVLVGSLAVAMGIGIGLPHVLADDLGLLAASGLAGLVCGLVLVVAGAVTVVRCVRGWRRILVVPLLAAIVGVAVMSLGQAAAATIVPATDVGADNPGRRGLLAVDAEFRTSDGVVLSGWYVPSTNGAGIAMLHGAGSTRAAVLDHAAVLARHGYGVLLFDARGHGRSGGRAMDFGWYGDQDLRAAVAYLQGRADVDDSRIAAVGLSMGGEEAIGGAAGEPHIKAVVAEGATGRVSSDRSWLSDVYGWRGAVQEGLESLTSGLTDLLTPAGRPIALREAVASIAPRPVLLIVGGAERDEEPADRYIRSGSPRSVELWVVPGTGHTDALRTRPREWEERVTQFLDAALG
jgi:fermentation-respiration switch protein FrsA (DUF1100 family)